MKKLSKLSKRALAFIVSMALLVTPLCMRGAFALPADEEIDYMKIRNLEGPSGVALGGIGVGYYEIDPTGKVTRNCINNVHKSFANAPKGCLVAVHDGTKATRLQRGTDTVYGMHGYNDSVYTGLWPYMNIDFENSLNGTANMGFSAYSGLSAHNVKDSAMPVVYYEVTLKNTTSSAKTMSSLLTFGDVIGRGMRDSSVEKPSDLNGESADWYDMSNPQTYAKGVTVSNGDATVNSGINHEDYIKVLDMVRSIQDNNLLCNYISMYDEYDEEDNTAIAYTSTLLLVDYSKMLNSDDWFVVPNQFSEDENVFVVSQIRATASVTAGGDYSTQIFIQDTGNKEKIERIISYLDWLCTEDGIIATRLGLDAERDENGILKVDSVRKNIPYARPMATEFVIDHVVAKYAPEKCYENDMHIFKTANAFEDTDVCILTGVHYDYSDTTYQQVAAQFCNDYMNGIKTKDDFNAYLKDLKNAGFNRIVKDIARLYR